MKRDATHANVNKRLLIIYFYEFNCGGHFQKHLSFIFSGWSTPCSLALHNIMEYCLLMSVVLCFTHICTIFALKVNIHLKKNARSFVSLCSSQSATSTSEHTQINALIGVWFHCATKKKKTPEAQCLFDIARGRAGVVLIEILGS